MFNTQRNSTLQEFLPSACQCALEEMLANTRGSVKFKETNFAFEKINKYFLTYFCCFLNFCFFNRKIDVNGYLSKDFGLICIDYNLMR